MAQIAVPPVTGLDNTLHWSTRAQARVRVPDRAGPATPSQKV